jgi:hypothetical protein
MVSQKYGSGSGSGSGEPPNETAGTSKKAANQEKNVARLKHPPPQGGRHPKRFHPLRAADMDIDSSGTEAASKEEAVPGKTGRPPPIILTPITKLIQLQKQLQIVVK